MCKHFRDVWTDLVVLFVGVPQTAWSLYRSKGQFGLDCIDEEGCDCHERA